MSPNNLRTSDLGRGYTDAVILLSTLPSVTKDTVVKNPSAAYEEMHELLPLPNLRMIIKQTNLVGENRS